MDRAGVGRGTGDSVLSTNQLLVSNNVGEQHEAVTSIAEERYENDLYATASRTSTKRRDSSICRTTGRHDRRGWHVLVPLLRGEHQAFAQRQAVPRLLHQQLPDHVDVVGAVGATPRRHSLAAPLGIVAGARADANPSSAVA